ncbi:unnamed protein product [Onchocerca flexuosa]|uniref:Uncharacterized protein n=1 Tax=Onchocerca flexuosa TaxID=387005 RepID=A0A183HY44_9BILA|nr:unnamed protein product [Onchocerca flexuosa]
MYDKSRSRDGSGDRAVRGTFAFGSSTPRIMSHLCDTTGKYSDDRINPQVGRRSYTTPTFPTPTRSKTVATPLHVQKNRTNGITQKSSGMEGKRAVSKNRCQVQSASHQSKEGSKDLMKKRLETKNDKTKSMRMVIAKEKQSKNEKAAGRSTFVENEFAKNEGPEESKKAGFGNENEKCLLFKEQKPAATLQLLNASTNENEARIPPVESISGEEIVKTVAEDNSITKASGMGRGIIQTLHEDSEGKNQPRSVGQGNITDTFSIISIKKNHADTDAKSDSKYNDEARREFSINSRSEERKPFPTMESYNAAPTAIITDSATMKLSSSSSSSVPDKTFSLSNDNDKLKNDKQMHCLKNSENEVKDRETISKNSNDKQIELESEQYRLSKTSELIPENLHQLQGNDPTTFSKQSEQIDGKHNLQSQL